MMTLLSELYPFSTIWVGLSGGMDSMVLLNQITQYPELKSKCRAIHVHHGLSPNAEQWLDFCKQQTQSLQVPLVYEKVKIQSASNIEESARDLRYGVYQQYVQSTDVLVLGHHLDDQIETFMMNVLRGSGLDGLSVMSMMKMQMGMMICRPLLNISRSEIESYAKQHQIDWIEDESNQNIRFARNYLRHEVLPKIQEYWPQYRKSMQKTLSHCQDALSCLGSDIENDYPSLQDNPAYLDCRILKKLPLFKVGMVIRQWLKQKKFPLPGHDVMSQIYHQMLMQERPDSNPCIRWRHIEAHVYQQGLYVIEHALKENENQVWTSFPKEIYLGTGQKLYAKKMVKGFQYHEHDKIEIRFRRGGEQFYWKGHHRCLKKLFQAWKVPTFLRNTVPLIYVNDVLKQVVGYAVECEDTVHHSLYQVTDSEV
jgi:tRNA(Ile)-lysidine synthase